MESVLGRYRNLIILVGVLFLQVLGLAVQVKRNNTEAENTRLIRIWAISAITPFERGLVWIQHSTGNLWHNYFYLRGVRAENRALKEQIEQMRIEQVRLNEDAAQAHRLQALLAFKEQYVSKTVAAQVIGSSGSDLSRIVYIDKGENAGVRRDLAVITADGIVGKVLQVFPTVSQVLLINDQTSGVGAILEKSRLQGVLRGTANGEVMLERIMSDEQVVAGERVLTSGGDQVFPKGLPVGTIAKVENGKDLFLSVRIRPAANLSKLEEVLVVTEKQERQATAENTERMRAADILAERLPSVPEKPAVPEGGGAKGTGAPTTAGGANSVVKPPSSPGTGPVAPGGTGSKVQTPLGAKPAANSGGSGATVAKTPSAKQNPVPAAGVTGPGVEGQPGANGESKPVVPKSPSSLVNGSGASTATKPANAAPPDPSKTKAPPQSNPQPPAADDSPH